MKSRNEGNKTKIPVVTKHAESRSAAADTDQGKICSFSDISTMASPETPGMLYRMCAESIKMIIK